MLQNMKIIILLAILHVGGMEAKTDIGLNFQEKTNIDPKEAFFKHFRLFNSQQSAESESESEPEPDPESNQFRNIPLPGGFEFSGFSASSSGSDCDNRKFNKDEDTTKEKHLMSEESAKNHLIRNDLVRLKRQLEDKAIVNKDIEIGRQKREPELEIRTKQMIGSELSRGADRERETRGVTKEQWIKQPYPVERTVEQESFDNNDNVPSASASDTIRAPRVHFVTTQRRPLVAPVPVPASAPTVFREREGRSRDRERDLYPHSYSYPHLYPVPVPLPVYPHPRPRSYEPYRPRYYDPYFQHYDDRERERRYRYGFDVFDDGRPMLPPPPPPPLPPPPPSPLQSKQRRIIYYATLPEVVRNPSSERPRPLPSDRDRQAEQRYSYRPEYNGYNGGYNGYNGHDGRYAHHPQSDTDYRSQKQRDHDREYNTHVRTSTNTNVSGGNANGSGNGNSSPTTNNNLNKTPLYPIKVSTDVNVRDREQKKTPERRIYSELDKRFNYKTPDDGNF